VGYTIILTKGSSRKSDCRSICETEICRPRIFSSGVDGRRRLVHVAVVLLKVSPRGLWISIGHRGREDHYILLLCDIHGCYREIGKFKSVKRRRKGSMDTATLAARASWIARLDSGRLDSTTAGARLYCATLAVQESDPACPDLRQKTLVPPRDRTHWDHTVRGE
jgi:hypothetical protein